MTEETKRTDMADDTTQATRALIEETTRQVMYAIAAVRSDSSYPGEAIARPAIARLANALSAATTAYGELVRKARAVPECLGEFNPSACADIVRALRAEPDTEEEDTDNGK